MAGRPRFRPVGVVVLVVVGVDDRDETGVSIFCIGCGEAIFGGLPRLLGTGVLEVDDGVAAEGFAAGVTGGVGGVLFFGGRPRDFGVLVSAFAPCPILVKPKP